MRCGTVGLARSPVQSTRSASVRDVALIRFSHHGITEYTVFCDGMYGRDFDVLGGNIANYDVDSIASNAGERGRHPTRCPVSR